VGALADQVLGAFERGVAVVGLGKQQDQVGRALRLVRQARGEGQSPSRLIASTCSRLASTRVTPAPPAAKAAP
jgi:hypothetical protein